MVHVSTTDEKRDDGADVLVVRDGCVFLGEQVIMQGGGTAPTCPSLSGASDRLYTVLIVLARAANS